MKVNLVRFKKNGSQKVFPLPKSTTIIGRQHDCDLRIPLMSVSKKHCQLNLDAGVLKIYDLDSRNGTYLNGKRINKESVIEAGNYIKIGPLTFALQVDGEPKDIPHPDTVLQKQPQKDEIQKKAEAKESPDDQFMSFEELEEGVSAKGDKEPAEDQFNDIFMESEEAGSLENAENMEDDEFTSLMLENGDSTEKSEEAIDELSGSFTDLEETDLPDGAAEDDQFSDLLLESEEAEASEKSKESTDDQLDAFADLEETGLLEEAKEIKEELQAFTSTDETETAADDQSVDFAELGDSEEPDSLIGADDDTDSSDDGLGPMDDFSDLGDLESLG